MLETKTSVLPPTSRELLSAKPFLMSPLVCSLPRVLVECSRQRRERMSSSHPGYGQPPSSFYQPQQRPAAPRWSLNDLSTEVLALILEQLRDIDSRYVFTARLLCRRFNEISIPIAFRTITLHERIVSPEAEQYFPEALSYIYAFTNHVIARSDLDPSGIKTILERIRKLCSVRWRYVDRDVRSGRFWMPSDILNEEQTYYDGTRLYVEELPLREFAGDMRNTYLRAIPIELLVSLKMAHPAPPLVTRLSSLKNLLLSARRLETLHFEDRGQGTQFDFEPHDRLPAFRELSLRSYDWRHTRDEVARHWDFSRIVSLHLNSVPVFNFLSSVPFADLADLHTLHCEDFSAHLPDLRPEATRALHLLIARYIRALSHLSASVHLSLFPVNALLRHAHTLRSLRLRDHAGFGEEDRQCPSLPPSDVALLASHMRNLQTLELDMDGPESVDANGEISRLPWEDPFLRAVCSFPALDTLTLHVQTVERPFEDVIGLRRAALPPSSQYYDYQKPSHARPTRDRDYEAALRTLRVLAASKTGAAWRSITINVGGWKRVMVRRLSEGWRRQNERGIFAERCFVLDRSGPRSEMIVRELFPVEASRQSTPELDEDREGGRIEEEEEEDNEDNDEDDIGY